MPPLSSVRLQRTFTPLVIGFLVIGTGLFGLAIWYTDTATSISITPKQVAVTTSFVLRVGDTDTTEEGVLPATVTEEEVQATIDVAPPAEGSLVDTHATGIMTVKNESGSAQPLTGGTRFRAENGVIVRTDKRVDVPARGQTTVTVIADPLGVEGNLNVGRFTIVALSPSAQEKIYGQLENRMTGGQTRQGSTLDVGTLTKASADAQAKIEAELGPDQPGTVHLLEPKSVASDPAAGTPSDLYHVTVTMVAKKISYQASFLDGLIRQALSQKIDAGLTLSSVGTPTFTRTSDLELTLKIEATGQATLDANNPVLQPNALTGKTKSDVTNQLLSTGHIKSVSVSIVPGWQQTTPSRPERIKVILNQAQP